MISRGKHIQEPPLIQLNKISEIHLNYKRKISNQKTLVPYLCNLYPSWWRLLLPTEQE